MPQRITPWPWLRRPIRRDGRCDDAMHGAGGLVDLKLGHVTKDTHQLIVNLERVEFLDSTGLGVLVGGLKRVRAHDGSLDLVCTQERILKIFRITGLTKVFGIHDTVDEAITARKSEK